MWITDHNRQKKCFATINVTIKPNGWTIDSSYNNALQWENVNFTFLSLAW